MDRRIASTPLLALKTKIGAPPEIRSPFPSDRRAAQAKAGTVDHANAFMSKCRSKNRAERTIY
jgi:hypothetical protein